MEGFQVVPTDKRQKDDWYPTPEEASHALLSVETFSPTIWECACGDGSLSWVLRDAGYKTIDTDLNHYGFGQGGIDFLMEQKAAAPNIVTNPPYKLANQFILHAIHLGIEKHAWLLRLAFLEGQERYDSIFRLHPPADVYVFSKRLTIWRGDEDDAWYGKTGKTAYAWMVWKKGWRGPTQMGWL